MHRVIHRPVEILVDNAREHHADRLFCLLVGHGASITSEIT